MNPRVRLVVPAALASLFAFTALPAAGATQPAKLGLGNINHIVVIYQENHSFDNLTSKTGHSTSRTTSAPLTPHVRHRASLPPMVS